ncbi:hypothetical protein PYCC9005_003602 [Savitreella phatthalungensis]
MSTTANTPKGDAAINPPWKAKFQSVLGENMKQGNKDSLNLQLATLPTKEGIDSGRPRPSVRTCVFRGFVGQPRKPDDEPTGGNPIKDVSSSLVVVSTDRLMLKALQVADQQSRVDASKNHFPNGFEAVWWHQGTQEQLRFAGRAWLLLPEGHDNSHFPGDALKKQYIEVPAQHEAEWTWESERRRQFAKHSPGLRGSFQAPHPASKRTQEASKEIEKCTEVAGSVEEAESDEAKRQVKEALDRFSLLILEVEEVDYLKVAPPPQRVRWTLSANGQWEEQELCP